jgi:hypothetical protein
MMHGFSDDSMSGEGSKTLLLAGCVQKYTAWADFSFEWEAALAIPPSIDYFKMREARLMIKQFDGWNIPARDAKIKMLAEVASRYTPKIIVACISRAEFDDIVKPISPYLLRHPYFTVFYALLVKWAEWQYADGVSIPTDFVFDEQGIIGAETVIWYSYVKSLQAPHIAALMGSTPIFRDDKQVLPLQVADMVAWHMRRRIDFPDEDHRKWPTAVFESLDRAECQISREYLASMAEHMAQVPGIELVHDKPKGYKPPSLIKE